VSRPLFVVDALPDAALGQAYPLTGAEGHHAADVQRLRVGEELLLTDGVGGLATAVVTGAGKGRLELRLLTLSRTPPPAPRLVVAQGLAKGDRGELAVQAMTEVGVDEIVPWAASLIITSRLFTLIYDYYHGILGELLVRLHVVDEPVDFLGDDRWTMASMVPDTRGEQIGSNPSFGRIRSAASTSGDP